MPDRERHASRADLRQILERFEGRLTDADRRLAQLLLSDPAQGSYLSANEAARIAGTHPTSAVRFARKLGFANYTDLRAHVRRTVLGHDIDSAARMRERLARMAEGRILDAIVESEVRALRAVAGHVTQEQLEAAADAVIAAEQVLIMGTGHASVLVDLLTLRLRRSGYPAIGLTQLDWQARDAMARLAAGDAVVALAFRRISRRLAGFLRYAAEVGAKTILISDLVGVTHRPRPDVLLAASRGGIGESQSLTVPMALCNTLVLEVARRDGGRSVQALDRLTRGRQRLRAFGIE
jgi:DNA-binding MurR/RpiR family transcriptional regulator